MKSAISKIMNSFFFGEKREVKGLEMITNAFPGLLLIYCHTFLEINMFASIEGFVFMIILVVYTLMSNTAMAIVENGEFFNVGDRKKRFIVSRALQTCLFCIILVILFITLNILF